MKRVVIGIAIVAIVGAGIWYALGGSERGQANRFGQATGTEVTAIGDIQKAPDEYVGRTVTVEGKLIGECPSSGCWWYIRDATGEIRADSFGGGFALPLHQEGKSIRTTGKIVKADSGELQIAATGSELH
jgi:RecJ-like exonuclease